MKKRNKTSQLRQQYQKERKRIQGWQRRAEKRGFKFDKSVVPTLPKRVTQKALEKIKSLRPKKLYEQAKYYDIEKDTYVKGEEAKKVQQQELRRQRELEKETYRDRYPHDEDNNIPDYTYINSIENDLNDIPDVRYIKGGKEVSTGVLRDTMINALYDTMATYDDPNDYNNYLKTVYEQIQSSIHTVKYESSQEDNIHSSYATALSLIMKEDVPWDRATALAEETERMFGY